MLHEFVEGECLGVLDFDVNVDGFGELDGFSELEAGLKKTLDDPRFELTQKPNAAEPGDGAQDGCGLVHEISNFRTFRRKRQCQYAQRCTLNLQPVSLALAKTRAMAAR